MIQLRAAISLGLACSSCSLDQFEDQVATKGSSSGETGGTGGTGGGLSHTLILTTTDFATGALVTIDTDTEEVIERALVSADAIPFVHEDRVFVVNRFGFDYLDVYAPDDGWKRINQIPITLAGVPSTNPHAIAVGPAGEAYLTLYGASELFVLDLEQQGTSAIVGTIDLSTFEDEDGVAESSLAIAGPESLAIVVQRLDRGAGFAPVDDDLLVFIDYESTDIIDVDADADGDQGLVLPGTWPRQWRAKAAEPNIIYILNTGILRVELDTKSVDWAVPESRFVDAGFGGRLQAQSFVIDDAEGRVYVAAYDEAFLSVSLYRAKLDGSDAFVELAPGLNSVERTLAMVDDQLWFASTSLGDEGVVRFGLDGELELGPLDTGLPPYSMIRY